MLRSPLHQFHVSAGAKMIDFAGWEMPVHYRGIIDEHHHTRSAASVFDVSHMGRIKISGTDAETFLDHLCTRKLAGTPVGQSKYTHVCREDGGILDDVIVSRHEDYWYVVCNASNREKIVKWLGEHATERRVELSDETCDTAMIAIQGPSAIDIMDRVFGLHLKDLKRYWFTDGQFLGMTYSVYRCGYTGEDGAEAIIPASAVDLVLPLLFGEADCKPAGLGARDTLRLEAGMPLYGHELREDVDSLTAGQGWCVHLDDKDFIGADAMRKIRDAGVARQLVGLELPGKRIARQGYRLTCRDETAGEVTSGTMSPTLNKSIAMGFVDAAHAEPGTSLTVDLGRSVVEATVVKLPFYKRT